MIKYFIAFVMILSSTTVSATEPLQIVLENHNNKLRFYLVNIADSSVWINKRFCMGSIDDVEIALDIEDSKGKKYGFTPMANYGFLIDEDIYLLKPGWIVGKELLTRYLIQDYFLTPGKYKIRVIYQHVLYDPINEKEQWKSKGGIYSGRLITKWVSFEVTETDIKNNVDWHKRRDILKRDYW